MCDKMQKQYFNQYDCNGIVFNSGNGKFKVKAKINKMMNPTIIWWAANPPTYGNSFSGSGMPFPNPNVAYENTPNQGKVKAKNGYFEFNLHYPNAYYTGLGTVYNPPHVNFKLCGKNDRVYRIDLGEGIPFRRLTWEGGERPRNSPLFYEGRDKLEILSQDKLLKNRSYPKVNKVPKNFWGLSPPN